MVAFQRGVRRISNRRKRSPFCVALALLVASLWSSLEASSGPLRSPQQASGVRVAISSPEELPEALSRAWQNVTITLNATEFNLTESWTIGQSGISLVGDTNQPTLILCPLNGSDPTLRIGYGFCLGASSSDDLSRNGTLTITDVEFMHCHETAVVVEAVEGSREDELRVVFRRVVFAKNGRRLSNSSGGAVRVEPCSRPSCRKPVLQFDDCRFTENRGPMGGALFMEDGRLDIRHSSFEQNEADLAGGALYVRGVLGAEIYVEDSQFSGNVAYAEDALESMESFTQTLAEDHALSVAGHGGAILAVRPTRVSILSTSFINNTGYRGGGAVAVVNSTVAPLLNRRSPFRIVDSDFQGNIGYSPALSGPLGARRLVTEFYYGGALLISAESSLSNPWLIQQSNLSGNRALTGGAVAFNALATIPAWHQIRGSVFEDNAALTTGGDLVALSTRVEVMGTTFRRARATYGGSVFLWERAVIRFLQDPNDRTAGNLIEGATAFYGGAIFLNDGGELHPAALRVTNNTAFRMGGGARMVNTARPIILSGVVFENNRALVGGGIAVQGARLLVIQSLEDRPSIFRNNIAALGGGLHCEPGELQFLFVANISDALFRGNRVLLASSREMAELFEGGAHYRPDPLNAEIIVSGPIEEDQRQQYAVAFSSVSAGHGGGICIALTGPLALSLVEVTLQNVQVLENEAFIGGGMSVLMAGLSWDAISSSRCASAVLGIDGCRRFAMHNVIVTKNSAVYAGGLFATRPEGIRFACSAGKNVQEASLLSYTADSPLDSLVHECSVIAENSLMTDSGSEGANVGAWAASLAVEGRDKLLKTVASDEPLQIRCNEQKDPDCAVLRIAVKDAFGQTIRRGSEDAGLRLLVESPNIAGAVRYVAVNGIAVISDTRTRGINISSSLTISSETDPSVKLTLEFSTRECYPGETDQEEVCLRCLVEQYGFNASAHSCRPCEPNANCSGGAALVPLDGYWHSTPFSPAFRKCIYSVACSYEGRQEKLGTFFENPARLQTALEQLNAAIADSGTTTMLYPNYQQCDEGYEGPLCGSCRHGYGRSYSGTCKKCPDASSTYSVTVVLSTLWLYVLIGVNCLFTLFSMESRIQLVKHEQAMLEHEEPALLRRQPARKNIQPCSSRNIHPRAQRVAVRSNQGVTLLAEGAPGSNGRVDTSAVAAGEVIATAQLTETLKILVNYLQITSVAARLQIEWNSTLKGYLHAAAFMTGVLPSALVSVSFECNFKDDAEPPIKALWLRLATPWVVLVCLVATFVVFWSLNILRRKIRHQPVDYSGEHFLTYVIAISVVSIYVSYIDVLREFLRAVNCLRLESAEETLGRDHPYVSYAMEPETRTVWAEDTALECFSGAHLPVGIVGVVGLFISFMGIVSIIVWLPLNRRRMMKPSFVARYWFLYQAYRQQWYTIAWESTVLTRKCLITAVVVLAVRLDPILQATLCAGLLTLSLVLTSFFSPFKIPDGYKNTPVYAGGFFRALHLPKLGKAWVNLSNAIHLNVLESASLAASITMFYAVVVQHADTASHAGRISMVCFTFVVNAAFLLYVFYRLYLGMHVVLDKKLEKYYADAPPRGMNALSMCAFFRKARSWVSATRLNRRNQLNERLENGCPIAVELTTHLENASGGLATT